MNKIKKFEDGTKDVFYKIQFMSDLSSRELRTLLYLYLTINNSFYQYCSSVKRTPLSINTPLEQSNHALKRICYEISLESRQEGLEIFWLSKDVSSLVDDPPGNLKTRHDQPDLERSENKFFSEGMIRWFKECVDEYRVCC